MEYVPDRLECPWCGQVGVLEYEDFASGNGDNQETECASCEKPLITTVDTLFSVRKKEN